jgi:hypothetical protein
MRSVFSALAFFALIAGQFVAVIAVHSLWHGKRTQHSQKLTDEASTPNDSRPVAPTSLRQV